MMCCIAKNVEKWVVSRKFISSRLLCWASELVCNLLYHMELGYARNDGTNQHTILAFIWGHSPPFEKQDILNTQIEHSTMNG